MKKFFRFVIPKENLIWLYNIAFRKADKLKATIFFSVVSYHIICASNEGSFQNEINKKLDQFIT